ncbi:MAG: alanine--tRNA ligase [Gammaproteobacteria bacterium]
MSSSAELRELFLDFFKKHDHQLVPSSPLVPANDPTLLFTNAGMVQFKDVFLGNEDRPYKRAASSQCCVRAGGKHNDLENVGYTARHHTFFEMLGNFSFGDYFKREAIGYAWEFLTGTLELPRDRLWISVFKNDDETAAIWREKIGVAADRIARCGETDNFWTMGATGPCGPCTEIYYDHGPQLPGSPPGGRGQEGDRYVEIWNLVFTQYDRDAEGKLTPIPRPGVDTGMGLERIAAVMQGVHSNYEIDSFQHLIKAIAAFCGGKDLNQTSLQVIADHIRSCAFIVAEGVMPSNEGRGYVLRRIIRRAIRHGHKLGLREPFFYQLVGVLGHDMGQAYPHLAQAQAMIERVLRQEEARFAETLDQGLKVLDQALGKLSGRTIPGQIVFQLYDTFGFPVDLTADIARERGLKLDMPGFEQAMQEQRARARAASQFHVVAGAASLPKLSQKDTLEKTAFCGYDSLKKRTLITHVFIDGEAVDMVAAGQSGVLALRETPFYAESGGQVGDIGIIRARKGTFVVRDTQKHAGVHLHLGTATMGELRVGDAVQASVDGNVRAATVLNHSATHLLHAALRRVLGEHVVQKGSLVAPDRLRFDFSHGESVSPQQLREIEGLVNREIRGNHPARAQTMPMENALQSGALALFGEKYEESVRVLRMGDFSIELCGGTHVKRTGDIGLFKILSESGVASGIRRIEALTGEAAIEWMEQTEIRLGDIAACVKASREEAAEKVEQLAQRARLQEKELQTLKSKLFSRKGTDLCEQAVEVGGVKVLAARIEQADAGELRNTVDQLRDKLGTAAVVLATVDDSKVRLVAGVTKNATAKLSASELVNYVAAQVGGKGGGREDLAQAGGTDPSKLTSALAGVADWVRHRLENCTG